VREIRECGRGRSEREVIGSNNFIGEYWVVGQAYDTLLWLVQPVRYFFLGDQKKNDERGIFIVGF
jgi:hypothetical protein